ncbi:hypothetical protein D3Z60_02565 [Lachnospiraceae bacterium]|nr:hypothetical protein [Lachnospiraceae bacterium]
MTYIEHIQKEVENGNPVFLLSVSATKEEIVNADVDTFAKIINTRVLNTSDGKPCRCYCIDCGRKGVPLKECHVHIRETLLKEVSA